MSKEEHPNQQSAETQNPQDKIREMIGGVLATGLWFFLDLYFFYPEHHTAGYWLAVLFVVAQLIQTSFFSVKGTTVAVAILLLVAGLGTRLLPPTPRPEPKPYGELTPANESVPPDECSGPTADDKLWRIFLADSEVIVRKAQANYQTFNIVTIRGDNVLVVRYIHKKLAIDAKIFDERGYVIAVVESNHFRVNRSNVFYIESDGHSLSVIDQHDQPAFTVRFINPNVFSVAGTFRGVGSRYVRIDAKGIEMTGIYGTLSRLMLPPSFTDFAIVGHGITTVGRISKSCFGMVPSELGIINLD